MGVHVPLLGRTEDQKEKSTAAERPFFRLGWACESMITNSLLCAMDWLYNSPLEGERLTPSQAADGRALLRFLLWISVAAAAAAVAALCQPAGRRIRLYFAHVALAFTIATHCIKIWLLFRFVVLPLPAQESSRLLSSFFALAVVAVAALDLVFFVALHRGDGEKE